MFRSSRRGLAGVGLALAAVGIGGRAKAASSVPLVPEGAQTLEELSNRLAGAPRRRDFKTVLMILDNRDLWDADALDAVLHYAGGPKQSWDNTELLSPWLSAMRNSMNNEVFSFRHPDFLLVSATRGSALLALYDDALWEKYGLAKLAGAKVSRNVFFAPPPAAFHDPADYQNPEGAFSAHADSVQALQRRGAVFMACHNAIWGQCEHLIASGVNPDKLSVEAMCAEFTNHLAPGVVVIPGAVGTLVELPTAGFSYCR
jgi:hypothetical protein